MHRRASSSNIFSTFSRARRERQLQTAASGPDEERGRRSGRPPSHRAHAGATRGRQDPNYDSWSPSQHALLSASCVECFLFVSVSRFIYLSEEVRRAPPGPYTPSRTIRVKITEGTREHLILSLLFYSSSFPSHAPFPLPPSLHLFYLSSSFSSFSHLLPPLRFSFNRLRRYHQTSDRSLRK